MDHPETISHRSGGREGTWEYQKAVIDFEYSRGSKVLRQCLQSPFIHAKKLFFLHHFPN